MLNLGVLSVLNPWLFAVTVLFGLTPILAAEKPKNEILIVTRPTDLLTYRDEQLSVAERLPQELLLKAIKTGPAGGPREKSEFTLVSVIRNGAPQRGWIRTCDSLNLSTFDARPGHPVEADANATGTDEIPPLIRRENENIRTAWIQIQKTILENEQLRQPLPEPYFARGEIWGAVNHHDAAMQDYLRAARIVGDNDQADLVQHSRYFHKLYSALQKLDAQPKPEYPGESLRFFSAGYRAFFEGNAPEYALRQFEYALQLNSKEPLYYYFRALVYRRLGQESAALRDARRGAHYEGEFISKYERAGVDHGLYRVQGSDRLWLQEIRNGRPQYNPQRDMSIPHTLRTVVSNPR